MGLRSCDPTDSPEFEAGALRDDTDLETLQRGVRLARDICEQSALRDILGQEIWPGDGVSSAAGSNMLGESIRNHARTIFHPAGTCRMGPRDVDVVDLHLRVRGIVGLRVADCSIMPTLVSGNTNAPTMMIADRVADFILSEGCCP